MLPMDFCGVGRGQERRPRALALLDKLGIGEQADKLPADLSGGQQQRAAIARALANDPPLLVADEPTGNLDTRTTIEVVDLFQALTHEGRTVVMVTHERDLASYFTDTKLPGVGISIGLTRLFSKLREAGLLRMPPRTPAQVLVTTMDGANLGEYLKMASTLRDAGVNTEVYLEQAKLKKQFEYAERKGFRVALIAGSDEFAKGMVKIKNLATRSESDYPRSQLVESVNKVLEQSKG